MAGVRAEAKNFQMVDPEPEICSSGFIDTVRGVSELYKQYNGFSIQWTKSFWSRIQKHIDVGSWSKKFRCSELEVDPEI